MACRFRFLIKKIHVLLFWVLHCAFLVSPCYQYKHKKHIIEIILHAFRKIRENHCPSGDRFAFGPSRTFSLGAIISRIFLKAWSIIYIYIYIPRYLKLMNTGFKSWVLFVSCYSFFHPKDNDYNGTGGFETLQKKLKDGRLMCKDVEDFLRQRYPFFELIFLSYYLFVLVD